MLGLVDEETAAEQARRAARAMLDPLPRNSFLPPAPTPAGACRAEALRDETVVCPCEGVTTGEIRTAAATGWADLAGVRAVTRAGMGLCQGRECAHAVSAAAGLGPATAPAFAARTPIRPVPIAALLAADPLAGERTE